MKKKGPIFVVRLDKGLQIAFRSFVPAKAWRKAIAYLDGLDQVERQNLATDQEVVKIPVTASDDLVGMTIEMPDGSTGRIKTIEKSGEHLYCVTAVLPGIETPIELPEYSMEKLVSLVVVAETAETVVGNNEDGFGLLRRRIIRVIEGLSGALSCSGYTFWGERHPFPVNHQEKKLFGQLKKLIGQKEALVLRNSLKLKVKRLMSKKKDEARAERKRKATEAKLTEKMESKRRKEAERLDRKREREEEKRMREEEKDMRKFLRHEKRLEQSKARQVAKKTQMKQKLEAIQERKQQRQSRSVVAVCRPISTEVEKEQFVEFLQKELKLRSKMAADKKKYLIEYAVWQRVKQSFEATPVAAQVDFPLLQSAIPHGVSVSSDGQNDLFFVWNFFSIFASVLQLSTVPSFEQWMDIVSLRDGSVADGNGRMPENSHGHILAFFHITVIRFLLKEYYPTLDLGSVPFEDFTKTRPLNIFTWPEVARICLYISTLEDSAIRGVRGNKTGRYENSDLREELNARGQDILENKAVSATKPAVHHPISAPEVGNSIGATGIVFKVRPTGLLVDDEGVLTSITPVEAEEDKYRKIRVGMHLVSVNGHLLDGLTADEIHSHLSKAHEPVGIVVSEKALESREQKTELTLPQQLRRCAVVIHTLQQKEAAAPFNQPVDRELYPDYYDGRLIAEPMDLRTIEEKLEDDEYESVEMFESDVELVWTNCFLYNGEQTSISQMAKRLDRSFQRLMKEWVYAATPRGLNYLVEDYCRSCGYSFGADGLIVCDMCDIRYHKFCLSPALLKLPKGRWYCPECIEDAPDQDEEQYEMEQEFTETRVSKAISLLSEENYTGHVATVENRAVVLRALCDLVLSCPSVEAQIAQAQETALMLRRDAEQEPLFELERKWDTFAPSENESSAKCSFQASFDGEDFDLSTDEDIQHALDHFNGTEEIQAVMEDVIHSIEHQESEDEEENLLETLSDAFKTEVEKNQDMCVACGCFSTDLIQCIQCPSTKTLKVAPEYVIPRLLYCSDSQTGPFRSESIRNVGKIVVLNDLFVLEDTPGVIVYAIDDIIVKPEKMSSIEKFRKLSGTIVYLFDTSIATFNTAVGNLSSPSLEEFKRSIYIVNSGAISKRKVKYLEHDGVKFVKSSQVDGIVKGDAVLSVNDKSVCFYREMDPLKLEQELEILKQTQKRVAEHRYTVTFTAGPLGMGLAMAPDSQIIVVRSLNNPNGMLGQAALSGKVQAGDEIKLINGRTYSARDLSHFTSLLLAEPRPLEISFYRPMGLKVPRTSVTVDQNLVITKSSCLGIVSVGDKVKKVNGLPVTSLEVYQQNLTDILTLEVIPGVAQRQYVWAHPDCVRIYEEAHAEAQKLVDEMDQARQLEEALYMTIPRTSAVGPCRNGHLYYQFMSDMTKVYIQPKDKGNWLICTNIEQLLDYLSFEPKLADQIRRKYHRILHSTPSLHRIQLRDIATARPVTQFEIPDCCEFSLHQYWNKGPLSLRKCIYYDTSRNRYSCEILYFGQRYHLGSFSQPNEAEQVFECAVTNLVRSGCHISQSLRALPLESFPYPMATRLFRRTKPEPRKMITASVLRVLEYGVQQFQAQKLVPVVAESTLQATIQSAVDSAKSLLRGWTEYCRAPIPLHAQSIFRTSCACFQAIKAVVLSLTRNPRNAPHPMTFAAFYHTYIVAFITQLTSLALIESEPLQANAQVMKAAADAFATALGCTADPSSENLARAYAAFMRIEVTCAQVQRSCSPAVVRVIHEIVGLMRLYKLSDTHCRPVTNCGHLSQAFQQELMILSTAKKSYETKARLGSDQYTVKFVEGALGIVINQDGDDGTIIVSQLATSGQARARGQIQIGDQVLAVNGKPIEQLGMSGFRVAAQSHMRPLSVTFKRSKRASPSPSPSPLASPASSTSSSVAKREENVDSTPVKTKAEDVSIPEDAGYRRSGRVPKPIAQMNTAEESQGDQFLINPGEPIAGVQGYMAVEVLDQHQECVAPLNPATAPILVYLRAQLLCIESCIPREAFKPGYWSVNVRTGWAEHVYSAETAVKLMDLLLFLESCIQMDWMEPIWKTTPLVTSRNASDGATCASVAMRLFAFDTCVFYMRKYKRKFVKAQIEKTDSTPRADINTDVFPSLPFLDRLPPRIRPLAARKMTELIARVARTNAPPSQVEKAYLGFMTGLSPDEVNTWYRTVAGEPEEPSPAITPKRQKRTASPKPKSKKTWHRFKPTVIGYPVPKGYDPTLYDRLKLVIACVMKNPVAWPFNEPVDVTLVPGYSKLISHPMDLGTINQKLEANGYKDRIEQFASDVNLVWKNCKVFNVEGSDIWKAGHRLECKY